MDRPDQHPDIATLQAENARLIALLDAHGIEWRLPPTPAAPPAEIESASLSTDEKIALFRKLFRGRSDVYPVRWESKTSGKSGYAPACGNEWRAGICEKPRVKCRECEHRLLMPLSDAVVYDRLFPNQDRMPKGGFGNLIALPLQKQPRESGCSVFVDADLRPYADQWSFLASVEPMAPQDIEPTILRATDGVHPLDVTFIDDEDLATPWKRSSDPAKKLAGNMPESLTVTLANHVYFEKTQLPQSLANRLIRLAAFQNPEFYRAQAMRMSVWDKPRVIGCAENYPQHIALPRGCFEASAEVLAENGVRLDLNDERYAGEPIDVTFAGTLRLDQEAAVSAMLHHDTGVLCAPTAFGKTVTAAAMIARRGVNTLVLVHRTELLKQWQERLQSFLGVGTGLVGKDWVGVVGGGKSKPRSIVDIAVMQSLSRKGEVKPLVEHYGQVIVDECHHVGAASLDAILRRAKAKYVRRDGQQPIIFMQCGPIRYKAGTPTGAPHDLEVVPRSRSARIDLPESSGIQEVFRHLVTDHTRTEAIAAEIKAVVDQGRKILVLTERTEHLEAIRSALNGVHPAPLVLHGRLSKKQRSALVAELDALPPDAPRIVLATGRLVGEGFDHPPLDTLVLAMPVSWKGTLQQYAGRLHREHANKSDVRIIDFVDTGHPALLRMWDKRQSGYRAMGYRLAAEVDVH
jgi:superfamily II DNA or RNA helicase